MLYLMMCKNNGNKNLVKVGVTRQLSARRHQYKSHNPYAIMRSSCAGTENQEIKCHSMLLKMGKRVRGTEWFEVSDEVFQNIYKQGMKIFFPNHSPIYFDEEFD